MRAAPVIKRYLLAASDNSITAAERAETLVRRREQSPFAGAGEEEKKTEEKASNQSVT